MARAQTMIQLFGSMVVISRHHVELSVTPNGRWWSKRWCWVEKGVRLVETGGHEPESKRAVSW